jgi:hypothetical protein
MGKFDEQRSASRRKAEELLSRKKQQEAERLSNRERDSRAMDEKTAKLRALRLAKEAADRTQVKPPTLVSRRKVAETA